VILLVSLSPDRPEATHAQKGYDHLFPAGDFPHSEIELSYPEGAYPVTSRFGDSHSRTPGKKKIPRRFRHTGIDIHARTGTPVLAAAPGRVVSVYWRDEGGNTIWIRSNLRGEEISLYYQHLNSVRVEAGDELVAGQEIGGVGYTMEGKGPEDAHLHFEVTTDEGWYDPALFLAAENGFVECAASEKDYSGRPWGSSDLPHPWLLYPVACTK
jgi:murein DD-endopeptidase MepM/ murein hydrolase activator NlpD